MDGEPKGVIVERPDLVDRPDLCRFWHSQLHVHCAEPVDPDTGEHPDKPHRGIGFPIP